MAQLPSGFQDPATDFSDGLKVLLAYHEHFLLEGQRLVALAETLVQNRLAEAGVAEARRLCNDYECAMGLHHRDEERALFPLVVNRSFLIDGMVERLALDHDEIEALWTELGSLLRHPEAGADPKHRSQLAHRYERLQREHIVRENEDFFPKLRGFLTRAELEALGRAMRLMRASTAADPIEE